MNKRNAIFMAILTFLSPAMTWASNNDQWQTSDTADQLAAIYQANQVGQLHMLSNLQSSIITLQNHIQTLESHKSNYCGIFGGKIGTTLSTFASAGLGLTGLALGLDTSINISTAMAYQDLQTLKKQGAVMLRTSKEAWYRALQLNEKDFEKILDQAFSGIFKTSLVALSAGLLFWYSLNKYDAIEKDKRLNAEIKRDQEIIEKLQAIQADRVFHTYQTN